jgi:transposase
MSDHSEAFVAFDTSKLRNTVAIADGGRSGEVRFLGEIENSAAATAKLVRKLAGKYGRLTFCYEAGPTGYGLYRQISSLGHACIVAAPSLIPKKPGDRVKTNRRDAVNLAKLLRAGELTAVWVPDPRHEAMRELSRARGAAVEDLRAKRQQVSSMLLRQGLHYPGKNTWTKVHLTWLISQKLDHREQRIAFEEMMLAVRQAQERIERLEQAIRAAVPDWSLAELVTALMAMRGIDLISAMTLAGGDRRSLAISICARADGISGLGAIRGFDRRYGQARPHYQSRQSAGAAAPWSSAPGAISIHPGWERKSRRRSQPPPRVVREIAWKAQCRLSARYRTLIRRSKLKNVAITAVARELAVSGWLIGQGGRPGVVSWLR